MLTIASIAASAQTKTDTIAKKKHEPKPEFKLDLGKPITLTLQVTLPAYVVYNFGIGESYGPSIDLQDQLTAHQATIIKADRQKVLDSLKAGIDRNFNAFQQAQLAKFKADTLLKFHPDSLALKAKKH